MPPEVTAVITTHARPEHVYEALASVRAETHRDLECVIVDDGGTFEPPASDSARELRVVRGQHLGVAAARNMGLAAARGEFVIFLDDDDVALPHRIATLLAAARSSGAELCFGMTRRAIAGTAHKLPAVPTTALSIAGVGLCDVLTCAPHVNSVLVRTSSLRSVGGFDAAASHFDDWSSWLRLADAGAGIQWVPSIVAEWRLHARGLTGTVMHTRAMRSRLIALFEHLEQLLSPDGAGAVRMARQVVATSEISSYDDYVHAITAARSILHAAGLCLGRRVQSHGSFVDPPVRARDLRSQP